MKHLPKVVKNKPEQIERHIQRTINESQKGSVASLEKIPEDEIQPGYKSEIKVEIESGIAGRNINQEATIKTNSQLRDYSMDEGAGIFEKKTIVANSSIEEAKDDVMTHRSYDLLVRMKSRSED